MHNPVVHFEMLSKDPAKLSNGGGASRFETLALLSARTVLCVESMNHGTCPLRRSAIVRSKSTSARSPSRSL